MKKIYLLRFCFSRLFILVALLSGWSLNALSQTTFSYTGAAQTYSIGTGITGLIVDARGGAGGSSFSYTGGSGGRVVCSLAVSSGQVLNIFVGGKGAGGSSCCSSFPAGGYNGGGTGSSYGSAGGGATDIRIGGTGLTNRVVVAGGGGGAGDWCGEAGGSGGGLIGGNGIYCGSYNSSYSGAGGTQSAGGLGATAVGGLNGTLGVGGNGYSGYYYGGAGGGGYYGGGGAYYGSGGGGSSYTDPVTATSPVHTQGYNAASDGSLIITPICGTPVAGSVVGASAVCVGSTTTLTDPTGTAGGTWSSSNPAIASVNASTGVVTGLTPGTVSIVYTVSYVCPGSTASASTNITVNPVPSAITGTRRICTGIPSTFATSSTGGTWSSATTSVATVNSFGLVSGVSAGTSVISYTLPTGCFATATATVNLTPAAVTGVTNACTGATSTLSDATSGGVWSSSNTAIATVGTTGIVSAVAQGSASIIYTMPSACFSSTLFTSNQQPTAITGTGTLCQGAATTLSNAYSGGAWSSSDISLASIGTGSGIVSAMSAGSPTITYTMPGGCYSTRLLTINPLPAAITGTTNVCVGLTTSLSSATGGGTWSSNNTSLATIGSVTGTVTGITQGNPTITYKIGTGCLVTAPFTVNPKPVAFAVTGGGGYCTGGAGVHVGLNSSTVGVSYQLSVDGTPVGSLIPDSSSGLDFGLQMTPGTYTVMGSYDATTCANGMTGSTTITINPLPTAYNVTGGGDYCAGGTGRQIGLDNSFPGVSYQLYNGATPVGSPLAGTGAALNFGYQTNSGTYTVLAMNGATSCSNNMSGSATINVNSLPNVYAVSGGGAYCTGGAGVDIMVPSPDAGINYQLYNTGVSTGSPVMSSGTSADFGLITTPGVYTVVGTDAVTNCSSNMTGSATVTVNPLPAVYNVTGGGGYCAGGTGTHVGLNFSNSGVTYYLNNSSGFVSSLPGTSAGLDFGLQTTPDVYTVTAANVYGCSISMSGSATVGINPLPADYTVPGGGAYCAGGTGVDLMLPGSDAGVNYQLFKGSLPVGSMMPGTGSPLDFGYKTAAGTYTVRATNATTTCAANMSGSASITINPLPAVYTVGGTGQYCAGGTGVDVTVSNSDAGVTYTLYHAGSVMGTLPGIGGSLNFGPQTLSGTYTVVATDGSSCNSNMAGSASITINPLPTAYGVTGGGNFCAGGAGVHVAQGVSSTGVTYQLMVGGLPVGSPVAGTGSPIDFGAQTTGGVYTVMGSNNTTGCVNNMAGSATVTVNPLPILYTVTTPGASSYCAGGTGVDVTLSGSDASISYQLYRGTTAVGSPVAGSTTTLDFGMMTTAGSYTVKATDPATSCMSNMVSSVVVTINPLPTRFAMTGGGNYCAGGTGVPVGLINSTNGFTYELLNGSTSMGTMTSTGTSLDFGLQTVAGPYTIVATNPATMCTNTMTGVATVGVTTPVTPSVTIASTHGDTVCEGSSNTFSAATTGAGTTPSYQWRVNGIATGTSAGSYSYIPANGDVVTLILTSSAPCAIPSVVEDTFVINTMPNQTASVSIAASAANVCPGTNVTFTATPTNGGTAPGYTWYKNGTVAGTTNSYAYTPADGDVLFALMNSNYACLTSTAASMSNNITEHVNAPVTPDFLLTVDETTNIVKGQSATFVANIIDAGTAPTYVWKVNGTAVAGATTSSYTFTSLVNNDVVSLTVTSHSSCGNVSATRSLTMTVSTVGIKQIATAGSTINVAPNPSKGIFAITGSLGTTATQQVTIEVTNLLGQTVYSNRVNATNGNLNEQVNINNVAAGAYILSVRSETENQVFHIVVE